MPLIWKPSANWPRACLPSRSPTLRPGAGGGAERGMGRWLTLELAQAGHRHAAGDSAAGQFVWDLSRTVLGSLPEQSAFSPTTLTSASTAGCASRPISSWRRVWRSTSMAAMSAGGCRGGQDRRRLRPVPALSRRLAGGLGARRNPSTSVPTKRQALLWRELTRTATRTARACSATCCSACTATSRCRTSRAPAGVRHQQPAAAPSSCARRHGAAYRRGGLRAQPKPRSLGRDSRYPRAGTAASFFRTAGERRERRAARQNPARSGCTGRT